MSTELGIATDLQIVGPDVVVVPSATTVFHKLDTVPDAILEQTWELYAEAFEVLRSEAAQRHVLFRDEFDAMMADPRITKIVGYDGPSFCALAVRTNDLAAWPLISPEYYAARFPEQFAARTIFYCGFYLVKPQYQRSGVVRDLVSAVALDAHLTRGIIAMDICGARRRMHMDKAMVRLSRSTAPHARAIFLDEQSFWAYDCSPLED